MTRLPPWLEHSQRAALLATAFLFSSGYATIGLLLVLLTVVAEGVLIRKLPWDRSPGDLYLIGFLGVFLISGWVSQFKPVAVASAGLAAVTVYLAFGALFRVLRRDHAFLTPFLWAWLIGGIVAGVWAIFLHRVTGRPAFTPAIGQNAVGTTLLIALILGVGLSFTSRRLLQLILAASCVVLALGLGESITRGAWLGAALGVACFFVLVGWRYAWRGFALLLLIGIIGTVLLGPERSNLVHRFLTTFDLAANEDRVFLLKSGVAVFRSHVVLGTGLNTFSRVYPSYQLPGDVDRPGPVPFAHNLFLNLAAEGGVLGLGAFLAIIVWAIAEGWHWYTGSASPHEALMSATVLAAFAGMLVHQLFDATMMSVHVGAGLWLLVATLAGAPHPAHASRASSAPDGSDAHGGLEG